jgi:Tfp pilus assembly PilM family ATPase
MSRRRALAVVELGSECVKVARLENRAGGYGLTGLRVGFFSGEPEQVRFVGSAFKDLRLHGVRVLVLLPRQMVNLRLLDLPSTEGAEVADMIDLQIGKHTPYTRDEIVSGYRVLAGAREGYSRVLLAIVQNTALRQKFQVLDLAGVEGECVSISTDGLIRWCAAALGDSMEGQTVAVLDVDVSSSEFLVLSDGQPLFTRNINQGFSALGDSEVSEQMLLELERSVEACQGELPGRTLSKIVVTGASGVQSGFAETVSKRLSVSCELMGAMRSVKTDTGIERNKEVSLAAIAGMAAEGARHSFNLLPATVIAKRMLMLKARNLTSFAVCAAALMVSLSAYAVFRYSLARGRLSVVEEELRTLQPAVSGVERMQEIISLVTARQGNRMSPALLLSEVAGAVPEDTGICGVNIEFPAHRMTLQADSGNTRLIRDFEEKLRGSGVLVSAKEANTTRDQATQRWVFEVDAELEAGQ